MDKYSRLRDNIKRLQGGQKISIWQGIVTEVNGITCTVDFGGFPVSDIRLRASEAEQNGQMLIVPKVGTAVTVGSLSGDLTNLVVLKVDAVERIIINDGELGGLVNIIELTAKINELIDAFNTHTHLVNTTGSATAQTGTAQAIASPAIKLDKKDYEDITITH